MINNRLMQKAMFIAEQMDADPDDVYDVLLGNITNPSSFVAEVEMYSSDWDLDDRRGNDRIS